MFIESTIPFIFVALFKLSSILGLEYTISLQPFLLQVLRMFYFVFTVSQSINVIFNMFLKLIVYWIFFTIIWDVP